MSRGIFPLHVITDTSVQRRFNHFELAEAAFAGGAPVVQYRKKDFELEKDLAELKAIADLARDLDRILIVNDNPQLALQVGAGGVHLGQDDGSPEAARNLLGVDAVIGATVHDLAELKVLRNSPIDYIGVGPVFGTQSKRLDLPELGLQNLSLICEASPFPVVGIGSIVLENVVQVIKAGATGVAVISAICKSTNPKEVVQEFLQRLAL